VSGLLESFEELECLLAFLGTPSEDFKGELTSRDGVFLTIPMLKTRTSFSTVYTFV
jgi:hypothetical protein